MKSDERGFALTTILILTLVLVVATFSSAVMTRTDTQIVVNKRNAARAFAIAEAGTEEALMRLRLSAGSTATVDGRTFDASLKGAFKPNSTLPQWRAEIVFGGVDVPTLVATDLVRTPSIQSAAERLAYSVDAGGEDPLTIEWECGQAANARCPVAGPIRKIDGKNVLRVTSWGRSLPARRMVSLIVTDATGIPGLHVDDGTHCPGVEVGGGSTITVDDGVQVNSTCDEALDGTNNTKITANSGDINVVGENDSSGEVEPDPNVGAPVQPDPLGTQGLNLPIPCFGTIASGCTNPPSTLQRQGAGTADLPVTNVVNTTQTLDPGIYYGGLSITGRATLRPGIYVMAGGGFSVTTGTGSVSGDGVMIYNTRTPSTLGQLLPAGQFGQIVLTSNAAVNLKAMTSGAWEGVVIFQDRLSTAVVDIQAGQPTTHVLGGIVYAIAADVVVQGSGTLQTSFIVASLDVQGGVDVIPPAIKFPGSEGPKVLAWKDF